MTEAEAREALARYEEMRARATKIVRAVQDHWWGHCDDDDAGATLRVDGDMLTLEWAEYDDGRVGREMSFPLALVVGTAEDAATWIAGVEEDRMAKEEAREAARQARMEGDERAELERLRAKFGG